MPSLIRVVRWLPVPRPIKVEWLQVLVDQAYAKDIRAARASGDAKKAESLGHDHQYERQLLEEEEDRRLTDELLREARRLRVPIPQKRNADGTESEHWYEGPLYYQQLLTTKGAAVIRDEIRKERKARHESRALWIPWLSAVTGAIGTATGLVALLTKGGP